MDHKQPRFVRVSRLCDALDVAPKTVHEWIETGLIRGAIRTPGGQHRIPESELERLLRGEPLPEQGPAVLAS